MEKSWDDDKVGGVFKRGRDCLESFRLIQLKASNESIKTMYSRCFCSRHIPELFGPQRSRPWFLVVVSSHITFCVVFLRSIGANGSEKLGRIFSRVWNASIVPKVSMSLSSIVVILTFLRYGGICLSCQILRVSS